MWRESWRRVTVVVVALVAAACTNAEADSTTTTAVAPANTTTAVETTTTTAPQTTTTNATLTSTITASTEPTATVGSPDALAELVSEGIAFSSLAYGQEIDPSIVPDLTALNAVMATQAIFEFEAQISTLAPAARWVDVFALPGSPAYFEYLRSFTSLEENRLRAEIAGDGYEINDVRLADEIEIPSSAQETLGDAPPGSFAVSITTSSGSIRFVNADGAVSSSNEGWSNRSRVVIVAPSDSGWKLFWTESL